MKLIYRQHAVRRMFERSISIADIDAAMASGPVIEEYPADTPYPSRLWLGLAGNRPLHWSSPTTPATASASSLPSMNPIQPYGWRTWPRGETHEVPHLPTRRNAPRRSDRSF
ncbi:MAG: DUF4258 domain-containing protein [Candidatus Accumulibacter sp.]|uniref:DUF4258 domain-containing protein n=1 Tax=Accumulibacter sp. TaxID=2053492 RepID=UPI0025FB4BBB|nr:DUF4258 domain-containing protein [Accumulibacter sp.]MCM8600066.1 DUF4258 domain-containing protein [Accumulibacter sp.]